MTNELRCDHKLHGIVVDDGVVEVRCASRFCGAERGVVVLHHFRTSDGQLIDTKRFKEPRRRKER